MEDARLWMPIETAARLEILAAQVGSALEVSKIAADMEIKEDVEWDDKFRDVFFDIPTEKLEAFLAAIVQTGVTIGMLDVFSIRQASIASAMRVEYEEFYERPKPKEWSPKRRP